MGKFGRDVLAYLGISYHNLTELDYLSSVTKEEKKWDSDIKKVNEDREGCN